MKKVYTFVVLILVLALAGQVHSQSLNIKGGLNLSNMNFDSDWIDDEDTDWKAGFIVGGSAEFPLAANLSLEAGMFIASKGYKASYSERDTWGGMTVEFKEEEKLNLLYLDVPITLKAVFPVSEDINVFGAIGPYLGFGITGTLEYEWTETWNGETESGSEEHDIEWGSGEEDDLKRLDYGLVIGGGLEFGNLLFGINYGMGLANISPHDDFDLEIKNRTISVTLGYRITL